MAYTGIGFVRHTLDTNWDRLEYLSNNDKLLRQILGVHVIDFGIEEMEFAYQTIVDNVSLIDEKMLEEINQLVVLHGQRLFKKKEDEGLRLKTDSFVLETNVHFPTDLNLLLDSLNKCLSIVKGICKNDKSIHGWRKINFLGKEVKREFRHTSNQVFKGKNETTKRNAVKSYLDKAELLHQRFNEFECEGADLSALHHYNGYVKVFMNQIERRLLKGETIPAEEKIYSIFEPHTEWITKGKSNPSVELGHNLLITTCQHQFIVDYKVLIKEPDVAQVPELLPRIKKIYPNRIIHSHSWDKGFWSPVNFELAKASGVENVIMPKKGKLNKMEKEREHSKEFKKMRNAHSAVESNINMLEHHGLNRCPDKGLDGFKRYVGLSVLAYNLHILGNHLIAKENKKSSKRLKRKSSQHRKAA